MKKRIFAMFMALVLMLTNFGGISTVKAADEFDGTKFNIKVVDESGNPVSGVGVYLKGGAQYGGGNFNVTIPGTSDEAGYIECDVADLEDAFSEMDYELVLVEGSEYEAKGDVTLTFGEDDDWNLFLEYVGNDEYTEEYGDIVFEVAKKAEAPATPEITSVTTTPGTVKSTGGTVTVTVTGTNLPETLYYKRTYEYKGTYGSMEDYYTDGYSGKSTSTEGSATERTFELSFPATSELTEKGATKWFVAVDPSGYDGFKKKATILIEEVEEPAEPEITSVTTTPGTVLSTGGKVTVTVKGTNLPETLYYKRTYEYAGTYGSMEGYYTDGYSGKSTSTEGSATERTFELTLPATSELSDKGVTKWNVAVDLSGYDGFKKKATVLVEEPAEEPAEPEITSVTTTPGTVLSTGGKVTVTVKGTNLPETLYYKRTYEYAGTYGSMEGYYTDGYSGKSTSTEGSATERTFELTLPATSELSDKGVTKWNVAVDLSGYDGFKKKATVLVEEPAEEPAELEITSVTTDKENLDFTSEGGTFTITVNGNLGDKVWYATQFNVSGGTVYNDLDYYASSVTPNADGTATIVIDVPSNTSSQKKYYRVRIQLEEPKLDEVQTSLEWSEDVKDVYYTVATSKVNKFVLEQALTDAGFLKQAEYTADSWKVLADAVAAGNEVVADENATQAQVEAATETIRDAIAALEKGSPAVTIEGTVEIADDQFVYDGKAVEPAVISVKDSEGNEIAAENYDVAYAEDSANVGKHNVTVTFKGAYAGEATAEYVVVPAEVEGLKGFRYQVGNRVKLEWKESTGATGYKVQYKSANSSKVYTKYVTTLEDVKSGLKCSKSYTFKVTPYYEDENGVKHMASSEMDSVKVTTAKAISKTVGQVSTVKVVKSSSKKVKVSWNNVKNETGYQISRSTKADGTNIVKTVRSTSAKSTTVSGGTKGTTYYYKVRAYRTVGTKKVYSDWTEVTAFTLE